MRSCVEEQQGFSRLTIGTEYRRMESHLESTGSAQKMGRSRRGRVDRLSRIWRAQSKTAALRPMLRGWTWLAGGEGWPRGQWFGPAELPGVAAKSVPRSQPFCPCSLSLLPKGSARSKIHLPPGVP